MLGEKQSKLHQANHRSFPFSLSRLSHYLRFCFFTNFICFYYNCTSAIYVWLLYNPSISLLDILLWRTSPTLTSTQKSPKMAKSSGFILKETPSFIVMTITEVGMTPRGTTITAMHNAANLQTPPMMSQQPRRLRMNSTCYRLSHKQALSDRRRSANCWNSSIHTRRTSMWR